MGRWVHSDSFRRARRVDVLRALGVVGFIRDRWVHSGAPWGWLGSFGRDLGIVGFIPVRWVHSGVPLVSSCSFAGSAQGVCLVH